MRAIADTLHTRLDRLDLVTDPDILESYCHDRALLAAAGKPALAVRARTRDDVVATLRVASDLGVPVVPRGAGSGLSGGANAIDGCIILCLDRMDRIIEIDPVRRTATVEPGLLNATLSAAAREHGLWYPPDPASRAFSTIGGNLATNAGGACCLKYGVTGDYVAELTCVLADGTLIPTGASTRKNVTGLDLTRLLVGSEGTLAVIVEATLRLRPLPPPPSTLVAVFPSVLLAADAAATIVDHSEPSLLELMDAVTVDAVERMSHMGLEGVGALLLAQFDTVGASAVCAHAATTCDHAGADYVVRTDDLEEGEQFLAARRMALPALERLGVTLLDDVAVPCDKLAALVAAVETIGRQHCLLIGTFGHAGDGNLHPTIVFDPADRRSERIAQIAFGEIMEAAIRLGGTLTGEHGIGSLKVPYLDLLIPNHVRELMSRVKQAFDPAGILNPERAY